MGRNDLVTEVTTLVVSLAPEPPGGASTRRRRISSTSCGYHSVALVELGFAVEDRFGTG